MKQFLLCKTCGKSYPIPDPELQQRQVCERDHQFEIFTIVVHYHFVVAGAEYDPAKNFGVVINRRRVSAIIIRTWTFSGGAAHKAYRSINGKTPGRLIDFFV